jgi:hypothetical protein
MEYKFAYSIDGGDWNHDVTDCKPCHKSIFTRFLAETLVEKYCHKFCEHSPCDIEIAYRCHKIAYRVEIQAVPEFHATYIPRKRKL